MQRQFSPEALFRDASIRDLTRSSLHKGDIVIGTTEPILGYKALTPSKDER
jgi:hypothetical protein